MSRGSTKATLILRAASIQPICSGSKLPGSIPGQRKNCPAVSNSGFRADTVTYAEVSQCADKRSDSQKTVSSSYCPGSWRGFRNLVRAAILGSQIKTSSHRSCHSHQRHPTFVWAPSETADTDANEYRNGSVRLSIQRKRVLSELSAHLTAGSFDTEFSW